MTAYQNRTLPRKCDYMERTAITGRLQMRPPLTPLRHLVLCVIEEKRTHPLFLGQELFSDSDDEEKRNKCNGFFCFERLERGMRT